MPLEEIEYIIKPNGEVEEKVKGIKGGFCQDVTKSLEHKLGEVVDREHTGEYYEQPQNSQQQQRL